MPGIKFKTRNIETYNKLKKAVENTVIVQKQRTITYGHWDFVVFGAVDKEQTILRVGYAEHSMIQRVPVYIAALGESGRSNIQGVPIEDFITDDIPDDYRGLEIFNVEPMRPLTISVKKQLNAIGQAADKICKEYESQNIAVIHAPHENDWVISVMTYLHDCDKNFPDSVQQSFRNRVAGYDTGSPDRGLLN